MKIRPIRTEHELNQIRAVAQDDGSHLYWPTHVIRRDDALIIGALSVMPAVLLWSHKVMKVRESLQVQDFFEGLVANQSRVVAVPCPLDSPYLQAMKKPEMNYINAGEVNLFLKGL